MCEWQGMPLCACVCVSGCMCVCVCGTVIYATFATFVISLALFFRIFPTFSCCFFARMCVRVCERGGGGGSGCGSLFVCFVLLTLLISLNARSIHLLCAPGHELAEICCRYVHPD